MYYDVAHTKEPGLDLHGHTVPTSKNESTVTSQLQTVSRVISKRVHIWMPHNFL